jgi:hypothetical protein
VAVWGTFDLDSFGDQLYPRITEDEIVRRLPGWTVRTYAPLGWERPCRSDGGFVAEPLGERSGKRLAQLAAAADLTLISTGIRGDYGYDTDVAPWFVSGLGAALERAHPVIWNAVGVESGSAQIRDALAARRYISVRDELSAQRLRECGVENDISVVPDPGVLAHRLIRSESLRPRVDYFRLMGWYPIDRPALIVQGDQSAVPHVKEIARILRWALAEVLIADVVILETAQSAFADLLGEQLDPARTFRLPFGLPPEDVLAAIHGSVGTVATDYHATLSSAMLGRRWALLDTADAHAELAAMLDEPAHRAKSTEELAEAIRVAFPKQPDPHKYAPLRDKADAHFDVVAEEAERAWIKNGGNSEHRWADVRRENVQLRAAYRASRMQLAAERRQLLEHIQLAANGNGLAAIPAEEIAKLRADSAELARLQQTKLIRWSTPARRIYGKLK